MEVSKKEGVCLILGYGAKAKPLLDKILSEEEIEGVVLTDQSCERELESVGRAKVIFLYAHEIPAAVSDLLRSSSGSQVVASGGLEELNNVSLEVLTKAKSYYILGGEKNLRNLVRYLANLAGKNVSYEEPEELPMQGIYHPEFGLFESLDDYLKVYTRKPLVGLLFWRSFWLYKDFGHINRLIKALEDEGLGVVPVFTYRKDPTTGLGVEKDEALEFFLKDGVPTIEALVSLISFGTADLKRLSELKVPVFSPVRSYYQSLENWERSEQGVDYMTQVYGVIIPEIIGAVEPIFFSGTRNEDGYQTSQIHEGQARYIAGRIRRWVELRKKPRGEVKIAVVLINPPCKGLEANVAVGMGLDVPESVVRLLHRLRDEGYFLGDDLPETGEELVKLILERKALSEFRWTSVEDIVSRGGAVDFVGFEEYMSWFQELPPDLRRKIVEGWGSPEEVLTGRVDKVLAGMVHNGRFVVPGVIFGNVLITPQPKFGCAGARCDGKVCRILHDPTIVPPHQWWAVYRWITRKFKADVVIHFGTHGYLEFRPGKGVGLSPSCVPQASIDDVPHLYVYIVSNPMEGVIAKRRGYAALIDHIYPPMAMANVLDDVNSLLNQYFKAKSLGDEIRRRKIYKQILKCAERNRIRITDPKNEERTVEEIHRFTDLIRGSQINMGLHVLGHPPEDPHKLAEYVATVMEYDSYSSPSIRRAILEAVGLDYNELRRNPTGMIGDVSNREMLRAAHEAAVMALEEVISRGFVVSQDALERVEDRLGTKLKDLEKIIKILNKAAEVAKKITECKKETSGMLSGISGTYVEPGQSGAITRGKFDILPTGRNFYAVDPRTIPTQAAWQVGVETAEKLLENYVKKHGKYPESVGQVLWSIDGYKADGEQVAQILYLLGVRPVWKDDFVVGVEIIPIEELKRPRIDVLVRMSGIVRDTLPNYIYLIDEAVEKVVTRDEPPEMNYIRKHYIEHIRELVELGRSLDEARKFARFRVFSSPPGSYGSGVNLAVESSGWRGGDDLGKVWVHWSGYAYSREAFGVKAHDSLTLGLREVDVINRNHMSDEHDLTNCCCYFAYHGGFKAAVDALTGKSVDIVQVDTRDVTDTKVVNVRDEIERVVRTKLLNDRWIDEMRKHGYRGASEFSKKILHLYGWEATTKLVEDWVFDEIAEKYALNDEMRRWFEKHNPYALEEIVRRLIEAYERGLWKTSDELIEKLREMYSELEGILEEELGQGDVQGGMIEIYTSEDDDHWKERIEEVEMMWKSLKKEGKEQVVSA